MKVGGATLPPATGEGAGVRTFSVTILAGGYTLSEELADRLTDVLAPYGASAHVRPVQASFSVVMSLRSGNAVDAVREALSAFHAAIARAGVPARRLLTITAEVEEP